MRRLSFIILSTVLLVSGSCIHEEAEYDPEILFIEPFEHQSVDMPDTLDVSVEISDHDPIRTVILSLVNENMVPVISSQYYFPNSTNFNIETTFALTDKSLPTGLYQIVANVSDGVNSKNGYREISINEVPDSVVAYIAVTAQLNFESTVVRLKPGFEADTQFVIPESFLLSGVQGLWGEFFFITAEPSVITAFNTKNFGKLWDMDAPLPRPLITAVFVDKELVYSTDNGNAGILSADGTPTLLTPPYENKTIRCLAADENYIYAAHVSLSGDINELTVYYRVTGAIRVQKTMSGAITFLVPERGRVLAFMPSVSGTGILEYDPEEMQPALQTIMDGQDVKSVAKISENQLVIVTGNKVVTYDIGFTSFADFADQSYEFCRYDALSDIIFLAGNKSVSGYDRISGELVLQKTFAEEVLDFQVLYNK